MSRGARVGVAGLVAIAIIACSAPSEVTPEPSFIIPSPPLPSTVVPDGTYVVVGDFGGGSDAQYRVASAIETLADEWALDGFITTGDNFYNDEVERIWTIPYGWLEDEAIPVFAAWGNHDLDTPTRVSLVEEYLDPPGRWYSAGIGDGTLVVLDSNDIGNPDQASWLSQTLGAADPPILVVFHHPPFSCGRHGSTNEVIEQWVPLFEEHDVALVLSGHDHDYQRFEHNSVTYVVTGGGGQPIRPAGSCSPTTPTPVTADNENHHFVLFEIGDDLVSVSVLTPDGELLDSFTTNPP